MTSILVVDDSPTVGSTVEWILRDHGYSVCVARDGLAALNALRTFNPDLLLLDIRLPNVNGVQLCKMLRSNIRYAELPIIMLSGLSDQGIIQQAFEAGADDYLVKPIDDQKLIHAVSKQLAKAEPS